jgi:NAD(P)-dependent dehydrogenase (short-subunit alcohol dehydrogenase family)
LFSADNMTGIKFGYRIAKVAMNQETRTVAIDFKKRTGITVMAIIPGPVPTGLCQWKGKITVEESASGVYGVI